MLRQDAKVVKLCQAEVDGLTGHVELIMVVPKMVGDGAELECSKQDLFYMSI